MEQRESGWRSKQLQRVAVGTEPPGDEENGIGRKDVECSSRRPANPDDLSKRRTRVDTKGNMIGGDLGAARVQDTMLGLRIAQSAEQSGRGHRVATKFAPTHKDNMGHIARRSWRITQVALCD